MVTPGCGGEVAGLLSLGIGTGIGAWLLTRERQHRALYEAEALRLAIANGDHREMEHTLRRQLALAQSGEAVSGERQWLSRLELGALLVAEWRFDEARELYVGDKTGLPIDLARAVDLRITELNVLSSTPDTDTLTAIQRQRGSEPRSAMRWRALEGLCLARMGRAREASQALEEGLAAMTRDPVRVAYLFHLGQSYEAMGERQLAASQYGDTLKAFPGTRLASEAQSRARALTSSDASDPFRNMLPAGDAPALETRPAADRGSSGTAIPKAATATPKEG